MDSIETKVANECQIKMKWRIKEDALKEAINNSNSVIVMKSEWFKAPKILGVEYYLSLEKQEENQIYLCLTLRFEMARKIGVAFNLFVKSASYKRYFKGICKESSEYGHPLCTRDELFDAEKKFFVNGIMEIELEGTLKALGIKRKAPESSSLGDVLWESEDDKELTIAVKDQEHKVRNNIICPIADCLIQIHKWVLCAKSHVFKAEMESGMKEARENRIEIPDFSFETHNVQFTLFDKASETNVVQLANACVTSNAKEFREFCVWFLINAIGKSSFIKDVKKLHQKITNEIVQRSVFPIAE
uniref:BTB domain-containing protein n=1 Tax=Panagrolaimus sp. PS1159 TaxID=55785 RepID=A0AC35G7R0_9BILA